MFDPFGPQSAATETIYRLIQQAVQADETTGSASETRRARRVGWDIYRLWALGNDVDVLTATGNNGRAYLKHLEEMYDAPSSVLNRLAQVRKLYHFWRQLGLTQADPFARLSGPPNEPAARRRMFSSPEVQQLMKIKGNENQAFLLLGLHVGLKASTLLALTWEQLDLNRNTIRPMFTEPPLALDSSTGRALSRLAIQRKAQGQKIAGKLFPGLHKPSDVDKLLNALCIKVKIKAKNWPALRNTAGVKQSKKSGLEIIRKTMGFKTQRSVRYLSEKRRYEEGEPVDNVRKARIRSERRE